MGLRQTRSLGTNFKISRSKLYYFQVVVRRSDLLLCSTLPLQSEFTVKEIIYQKISSMLMPLIFFCWWPSIISFEIYTIVLITVGTQKWSKNWKKVISTPWKWILTLKRRLFWLIFKHCVMCTTVVRLRCIRLLLSSFFITCARFSKDLDESHTEKG